MVVAELLKLSLTRESSSFLRFNTGLQQGRGVGVETIRKQRFPPFHRAGNSKPFNSEIRNMPHLDPIRGP